MIIGIVYPHEVQWMVSNMDCYPSNKINYSYAFTKNWIFVSMWWEEWPYSFPFGYDVFYGINASTKFCKGQKKSP